jgi:phosphoglycolate phosphatase
LASISTILFDLDGTLCDPREGIVRCLQHALRELGHTPPPDDQLPRYIGPPLCESFADLLNSSDAELVKQAVGLYRERFASKGMFENSVYPGINDLLERLHAEHCPLYVVTSKPTVFARRILSHFGLTAHFHEVYGSDLDGNRTDKSDLIAHVLEQEQIIPSEAVMIGDREHDIKGALANGVQPIGVLWGYGSRNELTEAGASVLCSTPECLSDTLSLNTRKNKSTLR